MCGIAAIVTKSELDISCRLKKMTDAISHRGPDGEGHWVSEKGRVGLGHRRLSIIDLSQSASQPMTILDRYVITFNGEIYNYLELKEKLVSYNFSYISTSDTEILLYYYHLFREKCLDFMDGMFSFIIYDKIEDKVFGARDRFGEKPFFYFYDANTHTYYFASEIKQFWSLGVMKGFNPELVYNFLKSGITFNPNDLTKSFYANICKIEKSTYFFINSNSLIEFHKYWTINLGEQTMEEEATSIKEIDFLLVKSITERLRADVSIGSSLSGGLDSSLIVSIIDMLDKQNSIVRNTFSARFNGFKRDESKFQDIVLKQVSSKGYFVYPDTENLLSQIDNVAYFQDEPFPTASILAQYEVFRLAKQNNTKVLLDGQGADEIFAGYYYYFKSFLNSKSFLKEPNAFLNYFWFVWNQNKFGMLSSLSSRSNLQVNSFIDKDFETYVRNKITTNLNTALYQSALNGALEELLRFADRNSMAHGVEVRLPYLSKDLVERAFRLQDDYKLRGFWTKWVLRKVAEKYLDPKITWRKDKVGYEVPQNNLLQEKIVTDTIEDMILLLKRDKYLNANTQFQDIEMDKNLQLRLFILSKFYN